MARTTSENLTFEFGKRNVNGGSILKILIENARRKGSFTPSTFHPGGGRGLGC